MTLDVADVTPCLVPTTATTTTPPPVDDPRRVDQDIVRFKRWAGGIKCQWIFFKEPFIEAPRIHVTIDHRTTRFKWWHHDATTIWLQEIYPDRFKACVRELAVFYFYHSKGGHDNNLHVQYLAYPQNAVVPHATLGNARWPAWTSQEKQAGIKCEWMDYGNGVHLKDPKALITTWHDEKKGGDAMTDWIQEVEATRLRACVRETRHHDNTHAQMNMAFMVWDKPIEGTQDGREKFDKWDLGTECKKISFGKSFSSAPVVQASINHFYAPNTLNDALTVWLEEVTPDGFEACARELAYREHGFGGHRDMYIDWLARPETLQV